ncbi:hypothetical protein HII36_23810 [Nonomuraea sp. NN258]|uniref:hypothetical protein n=1 Tax=Nonomuraea antri TaxID=2730852 RepID=UPI001568DADC|nr:hypothetical protein [Nonomuraea antri]NRQ34837.1 hypothetical protein [Nonomuraea antri]
MSVWLAAADTESVTACRSGCCIPVSAPLARHLVTACTRLGGLVIDLDAADDHVASTALALGCRAAATITDPALAGVIGKALATTHSDHDLEAADLRLTHPDTNFTALRDLARQAALVVLKQNRHPSDTRQEPATKTGTYEHASTSEVARAAELVKPGGHLVVVTGLHRTEHGVTDPTPRIIVQARHAGLVYLQHIVALRVRVTGEPIEAPAAWCPAMSGESARAGLPASVRVHSDLLIFTKPSGKPLGIPEVDGPVLGDRTWPEGVQ